MLIYIILTVFCWKSVSNQFHYGKTEFLYRNRYPISTLEAEKNHFNLLFDLKEDSAMLSNLGSIITVL